ncbi:glycoside hydrolase family 25 protein [Piedraia hortae CBS 480.64]|uniref:Lysozyme n=1 Tax=Piedraia hortae CBS 480.64 TaxID=1314780 RepID=A0A6A7C5C8_9PEZI|nr:glycoside hydrolase family 25 protein [Piedraia hortae CBS 480.64]
MKLSVTTIALTATLASAYPQLGGEPDALGFDISNHQPTVDYKAAYAGGLRFVFIKATEGTDYIDKVFPTHWAGARDAGFITGAYHYAHGTTDPVVQAQVFVKNGGKWQRDGKTLPGVVDMEGVCTGFSTDWLTKFTNEYRTLTGRNAIIYTSPSWWKTCMNNTAVFGKTNPLWLARWADAPGAVPPGWKNYTIWQYNDTNPYQGDSDRFNGGMDQVKRLAWG